MPLIGRKAANDSWSKIAENITMLFDAERNFHPEYQQYRFGQQVREEFQWFWHELKLKRGSCYLNSFSFMAVKETRPYTRHTVRLYRVCEKA